MRTVSIVVFWTAGCQGDWLEEGTPPLTEPDIPWLADGVPPVEAPRFDCPEGWDRLVEDEVEFCAPWGGQVPSCEAGTFLVPGEAGCVAIGPACQGEWPVGLPDTGVVYVRPGASGDGSPGAPVGTLDAALGLAVPGDTIALSTGDHSAPSSPITLDIALRGACVEGTRITGSVPEGGAAIDISSADVSLSDLTIANVDGAGIQGATCDLSLDRVDVRGTVDAGVSTDACHVTARDVAIREVGRALDGTAFGLLARRGSLDAARVDVAHVAGTMLRVEGGAEATLTDLVVREQLTGNHAFREDAVLVLGADVTLARAAVYRSLAHPVAATGGADLAAEDVWISVATATWSAGLAADGDAVIRGTRLVVEHTGNGAATYERDGSGGRLILEDTVIHDISGPWDNSGIGLAAYGGSIDATRVHIWSTPSVSAYVDGGEITATDAVLGWAGTFACGYASTGVLDVSNAVVGPCSSAGFYSRRSGGLVHLEDVAVRPSFDERLSSGLVAQAGRFAAQRVLIRDAGPHAVWSAPDDEDVVGGVELRDVVIDGVGPAEPEPVAMRMGLYLDGGDVLAERLSVRDTEGIGIRLTGSATGSLDDLALSTVAGADAAPGVGLIVDAGAQIEGARWELSGTSDAGAWIASGRLDVQDARISDFGTVGLVTSGSGADLTLTRVLVEQGGGTGLVLTNGQATLRRVVVREVPAGMHLAEQVDADLTRVHLDGADQATTDDDGGVPDVEL